MNTEICWRGDGDQPGCSSLASGRYSYEGLVNKGSSVLPSGDLDSWGEIPSKHEILHVQQLSVIISIFYVPLDIPDCVL